MNINDNSVFDGDEYLVLARLDIRSGAMDRALSKLKSALALAEFPVDVLIETARLYSQLGLFARARPLYEKYLEHVPNDIDALFQLGMTHFETGRGSEAMRLWDIVLASSTFYPPALFYKALALIQIEDRGTAEHLLSTLLERVEQDNLYFERGQKLLASLQNSQGQSAPIDVRLQ